MLKWKHNKHKQETNNDANTHHHPQLHEPKPSEVRQYQKALVATNAQPTNKPRQVLKESQT